MQTESLIQSVILPNERLLWTGTVDLAYIRRRRFRQKIATFAGVIFILLCVLQLIFVWGNPEKSIFDVSESGVLYIGLLIFILSSIVTIVAWRRQVVSENTVQAKDPEFLFILTTQRVLVYRPQHLSTSSLPLAFIRVELSLHSSGYGDILFYPNREKDFPNRIFNMPIPSFGFVDLSHAKEVYDLIIKTQSQSQE